MAGLGGLSKNLRLRDFEIIRNFNVCVDLVKTINRFCPLNYVAPENNSRVTPDFDDSSENDSLRFDKTGGSSFGVL